MRQFIAVMACSLLLVPAHATDDDRYSYSPPRFQDYQTPYKPPTNYSPTQFLDRQINNQNAALQHRFGARAEFKPTAFTLASVNTPAWAPPRFEFSPPNFKPLATFKADLPKPALSKPEPKGFLGSIGAGVKGVFNALAAAVQKVGQAIGKMFTIDKAKITYEAQRDRLLKDNPSLRELAKGVFQVSPGQQLQHAGLTWEPNSTFKMNDDGRGLHLDLGVTLSPDLGGIRRADGQPLPVIMTLDDNRLTPVGIDFSRVEPQTPFNYTHPVAISGLGTVPAGATMTFEGLKPGAPNAPPLVSVSFQNARIDNPGKALEGIANLRNEKITLTQMEVRLQGKLNEINSLRVNRGDEKLFVSQYGETFSISQLEKKTAQATAVSSDLAKQSAKLSNDVTGAVLHTNELTTKLHGLLGTPPAGDFTLQETMPELAAVSQSLHQTSQALADQLSHGQYADVANRITVLEQAQAAHKNELEVLQEQSDLFVAFRQSLKGLVSSAELIASRASPESLKGPSPSTRAAAYFTEEKKSVLQETQNAIATLQAMVDKGILPAQEAKIKSAELLDFRNRLLAATPNSNDLKPSPQTIQLPDVATDRQLMGGFDATASQAQPASAFQLHLIPAVINTATNQSKTSSNRLSPNESGLTLATGGLNKAIKWLAGSLVGNKKDLVSAEIRREFPKGEFSPRASSKAIAKLSSNKMGYLMGHQYWERNAPSNNVLLVKSEGAYYKVLRSISGGKMVVDGWKTINSKTYSGLMETKRPIQTTWCNYAARIFAIEHGVSGPFVTSEHSAAEMYNSLKTEKYDTASHRFRAVTWQQAERYASNGGFAIVTIPGHIATLIGGFGGPKDFSSLKIYQAGGTFGSRTLTEGFGRNSFQLFKFFVWEKKIK